VRAQKTVLVVGAGGSHKFGLPLGSGLRKIIADDLNIMFDEWGRQLQSGSYEIVEALRLLVRREGQGGDINPHRHAAVQIAGSMRLSSSIDEYIERHKTDALKLQCARLAIAKAILTAERESKLYSDYSIGSDFLDEASDSWISYLLRDLTRGLGRQDLDQAFDNVAVVNFNYDRCLEHFCYHWFQRVYDLNEREASAVCQKLKIYHPYGSLGELPYQNLTTNVPFGADPTPQRLVDVSRCIRTYSEAVQESEQPSFMAHDVADAKKFVFLGFGFHPQNVSILSAGDKERVTVRCYATTQGIRQPRMEIIRSQIAQTLRVKAPNGLYFEDLQGTCEDFWDEYGDVIVQ
jgi:hypothetical protein